MTKKFSHNPFEALKDLRDTLPAGHKPEKPDTKNLPKDEIREAIPASIGDASAEKVRNAEAEKRVAEIQKEDEALFQEVLNILDTLGHVNPRRKNSQKWYGGIRRAITESREYDTSYEIRRWLEGWINEVARSRADRLREIMNLLLQRAAESGAVKWIISATPEGMRYGTSSRDHRIAEAKASAERAGMTLEDIMQRHGISMEL